MSYCSSGDPEGRAWAWQKWRDGCGQHDPKKRLLQRGAQSEETLILKKIKKGRRTRKHPKEN